jgi:hypothetical protein
MPPHRTGTGRTKDERTRLSYGRLGPQSQVNSVGGGCQAQLGEEIDSWTVVCEDASR